MGAIALGAALLEGSLAEGLEADDRVVAVSHSRPPLEYYLSRSGVSRSFLTRDLEESTRLLVVVNKPRPQTLESVMQEARIPAGEFGEPRLIATFPHACLYAMSRR